MSKKKIGILGSGIVAKALAKGFIKYGYEIFFGTRDVSKLEDFKDKSGIGSFEEAAKFGEIIVLAGKGTAAEEILKLSGTENLKAKTIIDATNPLADVPPVNGVLKFFTGPDDSLMERLQKLCPDANFVKCFNSIGNAFMVDPDFNGARPTMFICGNDSDAKSEVQDILKEFKWEWADMGKVEAARAIEPLCILWCIPGLLRNEWNHAFKLLSNQG